jgi:hypothetical protein
VNHTSETRNGIDPYLLGNWYYHGQGVPQDKLEAVKWYRQAAEQEVNLEARGDALYGLALCYLEGEGIAEDRKEAIKLLRMALPITKYWRHERVNELLKRVEMETE